MVTVRWQKWVKTFHHPLYPMGYYFNFEKSVESIELAKAFAQAKSDDVMVRNVRIDDH